MGREVIKIREGSGGEGQLEWKLAFGCIFFFFFFFFPFAIYGWTCPFYMGERGSVPSSPLYP